MELNLKEALGQWYDLVYPVFQTRAMQSVGELMGKDLFNLQPKLDHVFRAFQLTAPHEVKVVVLGKDPYPGGEADGLAFSSKYKPRPYSLRIICMELESEGLGTRKSNDLEDWAKQGVLLLNPTLTTSKGIVGAHEGMGWEIFTGKVLQYIALSVQHPVFMSWGADAKRMIADNVFPNLHGKSACLLQSCHPSAQRHGYNFIGNGHFTKCNDYLTAHGKTPIQWT